MFQSSAMWCCKLHIRYRPTVLTNTKPSKCEALLCWPKSYSTQNAVQELDKESFSHFKIQKTCFVIHRNEPLGLISALSTSTSEALTSTARLHLNLSFTVVCSRSTFTFISVQEAQMGQWFKSTFKEFRCFFSVFVLTRAIKLWVLYVLGGKTSLHSLTYFLLTLGTNSCSGCSRFIIFSCPVHQEQHQ